MTSSIRLMVSDIVGAGEHPDNAAFRAVNDLANAVAAPAVVTIYGKYRITYDPGPWPSYSFVHEDYDGAPDAWRGGHDPRCGREETLAAARQEIDWIEHDLLSFPVPDDERLCPDCSGFGKILSETLMDMEQCPTCSGSGMLPDDDAEERAAFDDPAPPDIESSKEQKRWDDQIEQEQNDLLYGPMEDEEERGD